MQPENDEQDLLREYLLGNLDEGRQDRVEERLLSDKEFNQQLSEAQDDLIDDYVFGALSENERKSFDNRFLPTPERLEKFYFAQSIKRYVDSESSSEPLAPADARLPATWWQRLMGFLQPRRLKLGFALAALLLLAISYASWKAIERWNSQQQLARLREQRSKIEQEVSRLNKQPPTPEQLASTLQLPLKPNVFRAPGDLRRALINEGTDLLLLRLELSENQFQRYRAQLLTEGGAEIFAISDLEPQNDAADRVLNLRIPAKFLPTGDYRVKLTGTAADRQSADAGVYPFQVVNKNPPR